MQSTTDTAVEIMVLTMENERLQKELEKALEDKRAYFELYENEKMLREQAEEQNSQLQRELENAKALVKDLEKDIQFRDEKIMDYQEKIELPEKDRSEQILKLTEELRAQKEHINELTATGMYLEKDYAILEHRCENLLTELDQLTEEKEKLEDHFMGINSEDKEHENDQDEQFLHRLARKITELTEQNEELTKNQCPHFL